MSKGSAGRKGQLVEGRAKLRLEIPEMDEPTPLVSMLDSISSLRMSTAGSSEPTTEQLLRDYKSLGGISRGTCACDAACRESAQKDSRASARAVQRAGAAQMPAI